MKPHSNLPSDEHNLSALSGQPLPIIPADVSCYACVLHTSENRQQRTPGNSKFCWGFNTAQFQKAHTVSYCTVLDKDPNHLTRTPPILLSEEYLQSNFDYPKLPGDKWQQR